MIIKKTHKLRFHGLQSIPYVYTSVQILFVPAQHSGFSLNPQHLPFKTKHV